MESPALKNQAETGCATDHRRMQLGTSVVRGLLPRNTGTKIGSYGCTQATIISPVMLQLTFFNLNELAEGMA